MLPHLLLNLLTSRLFYSEKKKTTKNQAFLEKQTNKTPKPQEISVDFLIYLKDVQVVHLGMGAM